MMPTPHFCFEQILLIGEVQRHLIRLAELSRATAAAMAKRNYNLAGELDQEVENVLGAEAPWVLFATIARTTAADQRVLG